LAAATLFSTAGAAIKLSSLDSWQLAGFRSGVAALVLLPGLSGAKGKPAVPGIAVGVAYAATMVAFVTANKLTSAANAIFLQSTAPFYVLLLGPLLLGEAVRRADLLFMAALGFGLLAFFLGVEPSTATAPNPVLGNVIAAGTGLTWALTVLGLRWVSRDATNTSGTALFAGNVIAFSVCLPLALPLPPTSPRDWLLVAYLGAFQIALPYRLITRGLPHVTALEAALLLLLEPVLNPVWAWLVHGEVPAAWSLIGGATIVAATAVRTVHAARSSRGVEDAALVREVD
jgi:drug/metabolite transporter (DMT)-like permease